MESKNKAGNSNVNTNKNVNTNNNVNNHTITNNVIIDGQYLQKAKDKSSSTWYKKIILAGIVSLALAFATYYLNNKKGDKPAGITIDQSK